MKTPLTPSVLKALSIPPPNYAPPAHQSAAVLTHSWFDNFGGYAALRTFTSSTAEFDDITVVNEGSW